MISDTNPHITRGYASVASACGGSKLVHYRCCGSGPAVVLLHDSPRSSRLHVPLMKVLGRRFRVFALDTPGYGNSDPIGLDAPTIPDFAHALGEALDALGLRQAPVYATHTSAKIALALAARGGKMPLLVLDGLSIPDQLASDDFIAAYMRPFAPEPTGAFLGAEWSRTRDMLRWFPWFSTRPEHRIAMEPPSPEWMEDYGIDLFSAGPHYADAYTAAMRWNPLEDLHGVQVPTIVGARTDDVLYPHLDKVPCAANPALSVERLGTDRTVWANWIAESLATGSNDPAPARPASDSTARGYVAFAQSQIHWQRFSGPCTGEQRPLMILAEPSTLEAMSWAEAMRVHRPVIVPDLPGFGDSDTLPDMGAAAIADALAALIGRLEPEPCDVLAIGLAAPIGAMMAARRPGLVSTLTVIGAPPFDAATDAALLPPVAFDALAGSHLHQFWHMLRDGTVQSPWYSAAPDAARPAPDLPDAHTLHRALTGMLKQRTTYGSAVAAGLAVHDPALWQVVQTRTFVAVGDDPATAQAAKLIDLLPAGTAFMLPGDRKTAAAALHAALVRADQGAPEQAALQKVPAI